jgi:hypothetical protein
MIGETRLQPQLRYWVYSLLSDSSFFLFLTELSQSSEEPIFPFGGFNHEYAMFWATVDRERASERDDRRGGPQEAIRAFVRAAAQPPPRTALRRLTMAEESPLGLSDRIKGSEHTPWVLVPCWSAQLQAADS